MFYFLEKLISCAYMFFFMGRPKRISEPVKLNLLIDRESKMSAIALATKRKMSVGRLFEALLFKEQSEISNDDCLACENNMIESNPEAVEELPCLGNIIPSESLAAVAQSETSKS
jgi:hypothetical protein